MGTHLATRLSDQLAALAGVVRQRPIALILLSAAILRFWGIWHGYPFSYYPDEEHFVNRAVAFGSGDLNPHWFHKPALLMYLLFFEYGAMFALGWVAGVFGTVHDFAVFYFQNPWPFILLGRITVSLFGIATVYVAYKIGVLLWSQRAGLYAALLLALTNGHIAGGQDVKADVPSAFFTTLAIYFLLRVTHHRFQTRDYVLTGLFAGLGTATKYYSIALLPCLFIAGAYELIAARRFPAIKKYFFAVAAFWGSYFVASPFNFLDPLGQRSTFQNITRGLDKLLPFDLNPFPKLEGSELFMAERYTDHYLLRSLANYIEVLLSPGGAGLVIGLLFLIALFVLLVRPSLQVILLFSFPILFSAVSIVLAPSYTEPRHQLIIYPMLAIGAGFLLHTLTAHYRTRALQAAILMLLLWPLSTVARDNLHISRTDTRTLAKYWIEANIPAGTSILLDRYSPVLRQSVENLQASLEEAKRIKNGQFTAHLDRYYHYKMQAVSGVTYDIKEIRHPWWRNQEMGEGEVLLRSEYDEDFANPLNPYGVKAYDDYVAEGYTYVVTTDYAYQAYVDPGDIKSRNFPSFNAFYTELLSKGETIKVFDPRVLDRPGPLVQVIKISS